MSVCSACLALSGKGLSSPPHAGLRITQRQQPADGAAALQLRFACQRCGAEMRCGYDGRLGWGLYLPAGAAALAAEADGDPF